MHARARNAAAHVRAEWREREVGMMEPRVRALGRTNFAADEWLHGKPAFREFKPVRRIRSFFFFFFENCSVLKIKFFYYYRYMDRKIIGH